MRQEDLNSVGFFGPSIICTLRRSETRNNMIPIEIEFKQGLLITLNITA
jgi:hypothetical protein